MSSLHYLKSLASGIVGRAVLLWFVLSLGAAMASPLVNPVAMEVVCSSAGAVKVVVKTDDGVRELGASHLDCPLCMLSGAPASDMSSSDFPQMQPLGRVLQLIPAARLAARTQAPLPARGPPSA